ncbi:uncharacterized protein B0P05DRAFT_512228, partial [Gilbertella persicaria]|uniref:uncharacterized protein n=1 Tax=Gilbertella persicaria TaxID=101096 RepID=UPI00221FBB70
MKISFLSDQISIFYFTWLNILPQPNLKRTSSDTDAHNRQSTSQNPTSQNPTCQNPTCQKSINKSTFFSLFI